MPSSSVLFNNIIDNVDRSANRLRNKSYARLGCNICAACGGAAVCGGGGENGRPGRQSVMRCRSQPPPTLSSLQITYEVILYPADSAVAAAADKAVCAARWATQDHVSPPVCLSAATSAPVHRPIYFNSKDNLLIIQCDGYSVPAPLRPLHLD